MTSEIIGTTVQTSRDQGYTPGECECNKCSITVRDDDDKDNNKDGINIILGQTESCKPNDWRVAMQSCCNDLCPSQPFCVPLNKKECDIGLDSKGNNPVKLVEWNQNPPNIKCVYDSQYVNTDQQVVNFITKLGYNDQLMTQKCLEQTTFKCPDGMDKCSLFNSSSDMGVLCRDWLSIKPKLNQEKLLDIYCLSNDSPSECDCIHREKNPLYASVQSKLNGDGYCWYKACLQPQALKPLDQECPQECNQTMIQQLNEAEKELVACSLPPVVIPVQVDQWSWKSLLFILGLILVLGIVNFLWSSSPVQAQFRVAL